jgi:glutamate racemase
LTLSSAASSILVLDSGVGGLSVCQSILAKLPDTQIVYFADDAYFPYGLLDEEVLRSRLHEVVSAMLLQHKPDLVVLACNTVSTLVLPELRAEFDIPFVGVVPAIKPAAQLSQTGAIGLLATPATVKRPYTDNLIEDYARDCEVLRVGSSELVKQAEELLSGHPVDEDILSSILEPFRQEINGRSVDVVVMGCTHFPFLKAYLSEQLPGIKWIDSGEAIAKRVEHLLGEKAIRGLDASSGQNMETQHQVYFSKMIPNEEIFSQALIDLGLKQYQLHCFSASRD